MPPRLFEVPLYLHARHCLQHVGSPRFSTSSICRAQIPPESPKFIEIPRSIQPQQPFPIHMKGVLPIPRQIYKRNPRPQDTDKVSPEYLAGVAPEPIVDKASTARNTDPRTAEFVYWRARQAGARRRNLRESLVELNRRKLQKDRWLSARSNKRQAERSALLEAPEREDERLTNPSVLDSDKPKKQFALPDPDRDARLERKKENVARMEAMRQEHRRHALHTLYVNAGSFITTGAQLDATIDKVFDNNRQFTNDSEPGVNVWNLGFPETVEQLLDRSNNGSRRNAAKKALEGAEGNAGITRERIKKIAEELTGGKMLDRKIA